MARSGAPERPIRRHRRCTVRVAVEMYGDFGSRRALATTLGAGGLFVATAEPLAAGATLAVCFRLPGEAIPRRLAARVAWALSAAQAGSGRSPGMGLAFTDAAEVAALAHALDRGSDAARR